MIAKAIRIACLVGTVVYAVARPMQHCAIVGEPNPLCREINATKPRTANDVPHTDTAKDRTIRVGAKTVTRKSSDAPMFVAAVGRGEVTAVVPLPHTRAKSRAEDGCSPCGLALRARTATC